MLISIIIPTYNRAHTIGGAIESLLGQTYQNIEVIVVDDGSEDNTEEIVTAYRQKSQIPIKYVRKENGGCASARNMGLEYAKGECVAFLDDDDEMLPNALESLLERLNDSESDFVYSPSIEVFENGVERISLPAAAELPEKFAIEHFKTCNARSCCILYRKRVFDKIKGFDERLKHNEDSDFLQRVAICCRAAYTPMPSARVYHHRDNKSKNRVAIYRALFESTEAILDSFPEFRDSLGTVVEERVKEINIRLIEALVLSGQFEEAKSISANFRKELRTAVRLSLRLKSNIPYRAIGQLKKALNKMKIECLQVVMLRKN